MKKKTKNTTNNKNTQNEKSHGLMSKIDMGGKMEAIKTKTSKIKPNDIAKGAMIVSAVSGVVAAGAALADRGNRQKIGKVSEKGVRFVKEIATDLADETQARYQAAAHQISGAERTPKKGRKSQKGRKSTKTNTKSSSVD